MFKLLACDLDGTLMDETFTFTPRVKAAVARAADHSVAVTIATGRAYPSALSFAQELGITLPLICTQGGLVKDPLTGQVLHRAAMPPSLAHEVIGLSQQRGWHLILYVDDQVYLTGFWGPRRFYEQMFSLPLHIVGDLQACLGSGGFLSDFAAAAGRAGGSLDPTPRFDSPAEARMADLLSEVRLWYQPQYVIGRRRLDFLVVTPLGTRYNIEVDGRGHLTDNAVQRDAVRDAELEARRLKVVRVDARRIFYNENEIREFLRRLL